MTILIMVNYEWFEQWKDTTVRKRGDEYYNYKMRFAKNLFDWACTVFPKIKDKVGSICCQHMLNLIKNYTFKQKRNKSKAIGNVYKLLMLVC